MNRNYVFSFALTLHVILYVFCFFVSLSHPSTYKHTCLQYIHNYQQLAANRLVFIYFSGAPFEYLLRMIARRRTITSSPVWARTSTGRCWATWSTAYSLPTSRSSSPTRRGWRIRWSAASSAGPMRRTGERSHLLLALWLQKQEHIADLELTSL